MKKLLKSQDAITLVSLVVTIIILLILVGVSIHLTLGENGILRISKQAVGNYSTEQAKELTQLSQFQDTFPSIRIKDKEEWTKDGKTVTMSEKDGYLIKYTIDGSDPSNENGIEYIEPFEITDNCQIKATYVDITSGINGEIATEEITKIDKNPPHVLEINDLVAGTRTMTVTVVHAEDSESGISGEYSYKISYGNIDRGWSDYTTNTTYTFYNIYGNFLGVDCKVEVKTKDKAGNEMTIFAEKTAKTTGFNSTYYKTLSSRIRIL